MQTLAGDFSTLIDFRAADFDGDGAFDFLYADEDGIWVAWGTCNGAVGDPALVLSRHGGIAQIAFQETASESPYPPLLWLRTAHAASGDRLEAFRFVGRGLVLFREITESVKGGMRCTGHGLLFSTGAGSDLLLERNGALIRLMAVEDVPSDLDLEDVNGDGLMDLVVLIEDRLGIALGQQGDAFAPLRWLPTDEPVFSWDVQHDVHNNPGLLVCSRFDEGIDRWVWQSGDWKRTVVRPNNAGQLINHHSAQFDGAALLHHPVHHVVLGITYDVRTGEKSSVAITELPPGGVVRVSDFNGDGLDDVVAFDPSERRLHVIRNHGKPILAEARWSRQVLEAFEPLEGMPFAFATPMPKEWFQGQTWTGEGDWLVAESGLWALGSKSGAVSWYQSTAFPEAMTADVGPSEPCIDVGFLMYAPRPDRPCLPLDPSREWHRISYSRGPEGETVVAVDGQLVFEGFSQSQNFDHRMVQLGADFGVSWRGHLDAVLDEFRLYRGVVGAEDLMRLHGDSLEGEVLPLIGTVNLDGEEPRVAYPSYEEITWEGGVDEVGTPWGKGLRFDGETGHAYAFLDVPEDAVTFDIRFKINSFPEVSGTLVGLYGMYNVNTHIRWGHPLEPVVHSPDRFTKEEFTDNWGGHLLVQGGSIRRALPNGEVMRMEGGRWELIPSEVLPHGWTECAPWTQAGRLWGLFERGSVWRCNADAVRWEEVGRLKPFLRNIDHVVSTGAAAFVWSNDGALFGWLDAQANAYFPTVNQSLPERVMAARPGAGGVELLEPDGTWLFVPFPSSNAESTEVFLDFNPWGIMAGVSGLGLALGLGVMVRRKLSKREVTESEMPEAVRRSMELLLPFAGRQIEVHELDEVWGYAELETDETRRSRRSRSINELNAWSQRTMGGEGELIERQRDPLDRRRSIYVVREELRDCLFQGGKDLA